MMPQSEKESDGITLFMNPQQHLVARALYDNLAEAPDELPFRRGDVLMVLEQDTGGLAGWWLCALRGRQGICPGNRLRLLPAVSETSDSTEEVRRGKRRSWHIQPHKVITPQRVGDVYLYDVPPPAVPASGQATEQYDIPRGAVPATCYDVPRPLQPPVATDYDVPRATSPASSASSLSAPQSDTLSLSSAGGGSSNRSSLELGGRPDAQYDIPRPAAQIAPPSETYDHPRPAVTPDPAMTYDTPLNNPQSQELPLEIGAAVETLGRLHEEFGSAAHRVMSVGSDNTELQAASVRFRSAVDDVLAFAEGTLVNATKAADPALGTRLAALLDPVQTAQKKLFTVTSTFDREQLVGIAATLSEDVTQVASFIQGNAPLLFRRPGSGGDQTDGNWFQDYDYVSLESKDNVAKQHADVKADLPAAMQSKYDELVRRSEAPVAVNPVPMNSGSVLDSNDKQVVQFYTAQAAIHGGDLAAAIDAFLYTIENNQPPKVFVAHCKLLVLAAHKLVSIGDSVHRNISRNAVRTRVLQASNRLADGLNVAVQKTKKAAIQFPSVTAVQEMVDAVVDVSHFTAELRAAIDW